MTSQRRQEHLLPRNYVNDKVTNGSLSIEIAFICCLCFSTLVFILYHLTRKRRRRHPDENVIEFLLTLFFVYAI